MNPFVRVFQPQGTLRSEIAGVAVANPPEKRRLHIGTALRAQTIWAAHQMFLEDRIGSLEVGKEADLAVWDRDLLTVPSDALKDLKAELTLVHGEVVFHDTGSPVTIK